MSFSAAGTIGNSTASSFSITPHAVGNFFLLGVLAGFTVSSTTSWASSLSATNITWSVISVGGSAHTAFSASVGTEAIFLGKVTGTSAASTTISFNTGTPVTRTAWQEFSTTVGISSVTVDATGSVDLATSGHYPGITPTRASDLYWAYCWDTVTAAAGSTSGYTYQADANGNGMAYNPACANAAQTPNTGNTDGLSGLGVMLYEAGTSALAAPPYTSSQAVKRAAYY